MLDAESKKNLLKITVGSLILSAVTATVFIVIGQFDMSVVFGLLIGIILSVGNFYVMSVTVSKALETGDENLARKKIRNSYLIRTGAMVAIIAAAILIKPINPIPALVSVFYVRITIFVTGLFDKKKKAADDADATEIAETGGEPDGGSSEGTEDQPADPEEGPLEEDEEGQTDEFEEFVKRFSKGPVPGEEKNKKESKKEKQ